MDTDVTELDIALSDWDTIDMMSFIDTVSKSRTLESLSMYYPDCDEEFDELFANAISKNNSITSLHISFWTPVTINAIKMLADALTRNKSIIELYLHNNNLEIDRVLTIVQALSNNTTVRSLYLGDNQIYGDVQPIIDALMDNNTITKLDLTDIHASYDNIYLDNCLELRKIRMKNFSTLQALCWEKLKDKNLDGLPEIFILDCKHKLEESIFKYSTHAWHPRCKGLCRCI